MKNMLGTHPKIVVDQMWFIVEKGDEINEHEEQYEWSMFFH